MDAGAEITLDTGVELRADDRFGQSIDRPQRNGFAAVGDDADDDHGNLAQGWLDFEHGKHVPTAALGHHQVERDQVGLLFGRNAQHGGRVRTLDGFGAEVLDELAD